MAGASGVDIVECVGAHAPEALECIGITLATSALATRGSDMTCNGALSGHSLDIGNSSIARYGALKVHSHPVKPAMTAA